MSTSKYIVQVTIISTHSICVMTLFFSCCQISMLLLAIRPPDCTNLDPRRLSNLQVETDFEKVFWF